MSPRAPLRRAKTSSKTKAVALEADGDGDDDGVAGSSDEDDKETARQFASCCVSNRRGRFEEDGRGRGSSDEGEDDSSSSDSDGESEPVHDEAATGVPTVDGAGAPVAAPEQPQTYVAQWYTGLHDTRGSKFAKEKPCDKMDWEPVLNGPITTNPLSTIYDHFKAIFTEDVVLGEVAQHTNDEGKRRYGQPLPPAPRIPGRRKWVEVGRGTMLLHIALLIMMGVSHMPSPQHHWSHVYAGTAPSLLKYCVTRRLSVSSSCIVFCTCIAALGSRPEFTSIMPCKQFLTIKASLRFSSRDYLAQQIPLIDDKKDGRFDRCASLRPVFPHVIAWVRSCTTVSQDIVTSSLLCACCCFFRLHKVRFIVDQINANIKLGMLPGQCLSYDEMMIASKCTTVHRCTRVSSSYPA